MRFLRAVIKTAGAPALKKYFTKDFEEEEDPAEGAWKPALFNTIMGGAAGAGIGGVAHHIPQLIQAIRGKGGLPNKPDFNAGGAAIGAGIGGPALGLLTYLLWKAKKRKR